MNMTLGGKMVGLAAGLLLAGATCARADYVILKANDTKIEGQIERRKLDGTVIIKVMQGQGTVLQEFAKGDYKMAVADIPPEFAGGVAAYKAKNFQKAIETMEKIASDRAGLECDKAARYISARSFVGLGKPAEAVSQFDQLAKVYGDQILKDPDVGVEYAGALLAAKQNDKLSAVLDDLVKDAPRNIAGRAQTIRGEMREQQGQLDAALLDFMRTEAFFAKDAPEAVPEALFHAAKVLDSRHDPRAKVLYKKIAEEYKDSPYAKEAAGHV